MTSDPRADLGYASAPAPAAPVTLTETQRVVLGRVVAGKWWSSSRMSIAEMFARDDLRRMGLIVPKADRYVATNLGKAALERAKRSP